VQDGAPVPADPAPVDVRIGRSAVRRFDQAAGRLDEAIDEVRDLVEARFGPAERAAAGRLVGKLEGSLAALRKLAEKED